MWQLIAALLISYAAVGFLAYEAGSSDAGERARWEAEQAGSRTRHPSEGPTA